MAQFKFRLQNVLDYRRTLVDRTHFELATAQARLREEEQDLERLRAAESAATTRLSEVQRQQVHLPEVLQLSDHLSVLLGRIAEQSGAVDRARAEVERLHQQAVAQSKDAKALEKLRDRQSEETAVEQRRLEQIETSELAALQYQRLRVAV
jgi:flagellar FliJ protein